MFDLFIIARIRRNGERKFEWAEKVAQRCSDGSGRHKRMGKLVILYLTVKQNILAQAKSIYENSCVVKLGQEII